MLASAASVGLTCVNGYAWENVLQDCHTLGEELRIDTTCKTILLTVRVSTSSGRTSEYMP